MAIAGVIGATKTFSQMIHVSGVFSWPMTWDACDSYASNQFTIINVFKIFGRVESSLFFRSWINFHCTEKFLLRGSPLMFPALSGQFFHS